MSRGWKERDHPRDPDGQFREDWASRVSDQIGGVKYYHGTVQEDLEEVIPANAGGQRSVFPSDTDRDYAYASEKLEDAWHYAEMAWNASGSGRPRVYEVGPIVGDVEEDPMFRPDGTSRSNFEGDRRSRSGWRVLREVDFPEAWGDPEDWDS